MGVVPGLGTQVARELRALDAEYPLDAFRFERLAKGAAQGEDLFGVSANVKAAHM